MEKVGLVYDQCMGKHCAKDDHPECPDRIYSIYKELLASGLVKKMVPIRTKDATEDELLLVHSDNYVQSMDFMLRGPNNVIKKCEHKFNSIYVNKFTLESAKLAAGSTINIAREIATNKINSGVALVRPPGHHAHVNKASGFCIFNNVALGAKIALNYVNKVAIVDFDIHHGDGTENIIKTRFKEDEVLFISIHRYDDGAYYPGTGAPSETVNIYNFPLKDEGTDQKYRAIFKSYITKLLKEFSPDMILVSAGFDAAEGDPLGGYHLSPECYADMVRYMKESTPKILLVLEGGYNLNSISMSMKACVDVLFENGVKVEEKN